MLGGFDDVLLKALRAGELDFVVAELPAEENARDLELLPLTSDRLAVFCRDGHPLAGRNEPLALRELLAYPWVMPPASTRSQQRLNALFVAADLPPPDIAVETESMAFLLRVLVNFDALTFTVSSTAELVEAIGTGALDVPEITTERVAGIVTRKGGWASPASRAVIEDADHLLQPGPQLAIAKSYRSGILYYLLAYDRRASFSTGPTNVRGGRHEGTVVYRRQALAGLGAVALAGSSRFAFAATALPPVNIVINQSPWLASFRATVDLYQQQSGNKVNLEVVPFDGMLAKQRNSVRASTGDYDILILNSGWFAEMYFGGFTTALTDVDPSFKLDPDIFALGNTIYFDPASKTMTPSGKLMAMPIQPNIPMLFYRGDLYKEKGLKVVETFDDLLANAKALHNPPKMYGIIQRGARGANTVSYDFYPYLFGMGGAVFKDQVRATIRLPSTTTRARPPSTTTCGSPRRPGTRRPPRRTKPKSSSPWSPAIAPCQPRHCGVVADG